MGKHEGDSRGEEYKVPVCPHTTSFMWTLLSMLIVVPVGIIWIIVRMPKEIVRFFGTCLDAIRKSFLGLPCDYHKCKVCGERMKQEASRDIADVVNKWATIHSNESELR